MRYDSLTITLVYICQVMQYYICSIVIIIEAICVVHSPKTQICSMFPIVAQKTKLLISPSDLCLQLLRCSKPLQTITAYNFLPQIIWNHENKDNIEIGKPSRRAGLINGTKRNLRNRPPESQLYLVTPVTNRVILAMCFATK